MKIADGRPTPTRSMGLLLALVAMVSLFPFLGATPLFDEDEGYFSEVTREMMATGDYVTAHINGRPEYDKPPLTYWCQAIAFHLCGLNEYGARLPSALATWIWTLTIFGFVRPRLGTTAAFWSGLFIVSAVQITITGKAAVADALLNLFLTLCMFSAYAWWEDGRWRRLAAAGLFAGAGVMAKGPIAVLIPLAVGFCFCLSMGRINRFFVAAVHPAAWLPLGLVALPWYLAVYLRQGHAFVEDFFWQHHLRRFLDVLEGHGGSLFYYLPVVLVGVLPWSGLMVPATGRLRVFWRDPLLRFCILWFAITLLFFSLSATKLPHYVIVGYPPLFILLAVTFEKMTHADAVVMPALGLLVVLTAAPVLAAQIGPAVGDPFAAVVLAHVPETFDWRYLLCGTALAALLAAARLRGGDGSKWRQAATAAAVCLIMVNLIVMPRVGKLLQSPVKKAALIAARHNETVVMWGYFLPSFMFYSRKTVADRPPQAGELLITKETRLAQIETVRVVYRENGIALVRVISP